MTAFLDEIDDDVKRKYSLVRDFMLNYRHSRDRRLRDYPNSEYGFRAI